MVWVWKKGVWQARRERWKTIDQINWKWIWSVEIAIPNRLMLPHNKSTLLCRHSFVFGSYNLVLTYCVRRYEETQMAQDFSLICLTACERAERTLDPRLEISFSGCICSIFLIGHSVWNFIIWCLVFFACKFWITQNKMFWRSQEPWKWKGYEEDKVVWYC